MQFEWEPKKAQNNYKKHGVTFETAQLVFEDPFHISMEDIYHSDDEDRWITLGQAGFKMMIIVIHTYRTRKEQEVIRIISARKATARERRQYFNLPGGKK